MATPRMRGAIESLRQLQSFADDEGEKLTRRINDEVMPRLKEGFRTAHGTVDGFVGQVDEIDNFAKELMGHNGGDPLPSDDSSQPLPGGPRSSEVAGR